MISQEIYLEKYDWTIFVYYGANQQNADEVCNTLKKIGCSEKAIGEAMEHFLRGSENAGLTYSNTAERKSVVAISKTTSAEEFVNTVTHEMFHVVCHICGALGIDLNSEEPCYLMGWLCQSVSRLFI